MAKFKYYNANPEGKVLNDCVTRAISLATNTPYYVVKNLLTLSANSLGCCRICRPCYSRFLKNYYGLNAIDDDYHTVGELADKYPNNTLLLRTDGHLTCSINKTIYDLFDCRNEVVTHYWIVK